MKNSISDEHIKSVVKDTRFHRFDSTIVCCLTLANGYNVIGKASCVDPANFDEGLGKKLAKKDALREIWALEGYLLKQQLHTDATGNDK